MKKQTISFEYQVYGSVEELGSQDQELMQAAIKARKDAYAPYSNFLVGAAVLLENGEVVIGSNQENASYPSGLCAERVAVFHAGAKFPGVVIKAIAITAMSKNHLVDTPAAPCGNCRQAISEYEFRQKAPIPILMMGEKGEVIKCKSLADILPLGFNNTYL
ncbi:cytidine deaminase [Maribacter luteus]|uniref:Cytidine deaminase n=1 Tax=Maribacter luteus TaxID=2594478 RepID=A0A6I2MTD2_9FLAO|nr:cytidine deaminase [Maribacter luteus]MRX65855.1 cytidine deaminase [Maribacter luteus]|tara:strand:+ start:5353 stop:5835 length:483 start_codon:yes stop_codon:yes gene_type:complete